MTEDVQEVQQESSVARHRWLQFSIRTALAIMVVVAIGLGFRRQSVQHAAADRDFARLISVYEITRAHSLHLEKAEGFVPVLTDLWTRLLAEGGVGRVWQSKFLPVAAGAKQGAAASLASQPTFQDDEQFQPLADGGFRYVRSVRAETSCVAICHGAPSRADAPFGVQFQSGDVMGTIVLTVSPRAE